MVYNEKRPKISIQISTNLIYMDPPTPQRLACTPPRRLRRRRRHRGRRCKRGQSRQCGRILQIVFKFVGNLNAYFWPLFIINHVFSRSKSESTRKVLTKNGVKSKIVRIFAELHEYMGITQKNVQNMYRKCIENVQSMYRKCIENVQKKVQTIYRTCIENEFLYFVFLFF